MKICILFVWFFVNLFSFSHGCEGDYPEDNEAAGICSFWFEGVLLVSLITRWYSRNEIPHIIRTFHDNETVESPLNLQIVK